MHQQPSDTTRSITINRANAYLALARILEPPADWDDALAVIFRDLFRGVDPELHAEAVSIAESIEGAVQEIEELSVTHARLFLGPFEVLASPYASTYLDPDSRIMGPVSAEVASMYAEAGIGPSDGPTDAPDHVTRELEFMYLAIHRELTTLDDRWRERSDRFLRDHLARWLPEWAGQVLLTEDDSVFGRMARFVILFCERESQWLVAR